jgi:hypothetical protein|tara:strand:+ start:311 stop:565 length:255 start_codon:yes stop_codon:yes gene_type:complete
MKIAIRVKPVMVFFIYVPILLTLLSLVGQYSKYFLGNQNPLALVALFDVCGEENITNWYQSATLVIPSILFGLVALQLRKKQGS